MAAAGEQRYRHRILVSNLASYITCTISLMEETLQVSNP
jgi:hypothetical protein